MMSVNWLSFFVGVWFGAFAVVVGLVAKYKACKPKHQQGNYKGQQQRQYDELLRERRAIAVARTRVPSGCIAATITADYDKSADCMIAVAICGKSNPYQHWFSPEYVAENEEIRAERDWLRWQARHNDGAKA